MVPPATSTRIMDWRVPLWANQTYFPSKPEPPNAGVAPELVGIPEHPEGQLL